MKERVGLCFGKKSKEVQKVLDSLIDSKELDDFSSITELLKFSDERAVYYDRVLISPAAIPKGFDYKVLQNYVEAYRVHLVFLCSAKTDKMLADKLVVQFGMKHAILLLHSTALDLLQDCVTQPMSELIARGYKGADVEVKTLLGHREVEEAVLSTVDGEVVEDSKAKRGLLKGWFRVKGAKQVNKQLVEGDLTLKESNKESVSKKEGKSIEGVKDESKGEIKDELKDEIKDEIKDERGLEDTDCEVDLDLSDKDIGSIEGEYRELAKRKNIKIVEKEVIKKVIERVPVHQGSQKQSVVEAIIRGDAHKIIYVTGERGSGVTLTAYSLAKYFANKGVKTLYVDGDVMTHGILNYIDYSEYIKYDSAALQGVKVATTETLLEQSLVIIEDNLFALLTNYGVDVLDAQLKEVQQNIIDSYRNYGVVIIDVPLSKLHCFEDAILQGQGVFCVDTSKRGFMNFLTFMEKVSLPLRYKRSMCSKGVMCLTHNTGLGYAKIKSYVTSIIDFDDDLYWFDMPYQEFKGEWSKKLIDDLLML